MYPAGTSGRLDVAKVADADVVDVAFTTCTLTVPDGIVTLARVKLPMLVTVEPKVTVVLPIVAVLFAKYELGNVAATDVMFALANVPPESATELIVPPVITTALAFWVDIVPKPVTLAAGTVPLVMVTFARVRLPMLVIVDPSDTEVLPIVTALFVNWLFAMLPNVPPNVRFPVVVTLPVSVMPLTVPVPPTWVTVPLPPPPISAADIVFNMIKDRHPALCIPLPYLTL